MIKLNRLYKVLGISKQAVHQKLNRRLFLLNEKEQLLVLVRQIREDHPRMSSRQMYRLIKPPRFGRDRFEQFCFENGFKVAVKRSYQRTTNSLGVTRFENLLSGIELTGVNQVWVSDITYYRIGETFYYLTFIMDNFSRFIVGFSVSRDLLTRCTTIPAINLALRVRDVQKPFIFHSDGGGQYYCKEWLAITKRARMLNSMCDSPYDNPYAERINGIIKNDYLAGYGPSNFQELEQMTARAVNNYNTGKPHGSLGHISPETFEARLGVIHKSSKRKKVAKKEKTQKCG